MIFQKKITLTEKLSQFFLVFADGKMPFPDGGLEWLYELLQDVQLEQFFTRFRDDLQITRLSHFDYVQSEDLEKIGIGECCKCYRRCVLTLVLRLVDLPQAGTLYLEANHFRSDSPAPAAWRT